MSNPYEQLPGKELEIVRPPEPQPVAEGGRAWEEAYRAAVEHIEGLYDQYAPHISREDRAPGVLLGAAGLASVEGRYGRSELSPRAYSGYLEKGVLATYHHAGHSYDFIEDEFRYAAAVNDVEPGTYDTGAFMRFPIIGAHHDAIMGEGRGTDERLSAELAAEMMTRLGFTLLPDEPTAAAIASTTEEETEPSHAAIISTTWDQELKRQAFNTTGPYVEQQRAACVADLMTLFDQRGPYKAICLTIEDMCKLMNGRVFQRIAVENDFDYEYATVDECMQFVDQVPALETKFGDMLRSQPGFFENFQPADPRLDSFFPGRADNVAFLRLLSELYDARYESDTPMTAYRCLLAARDFMASAA